MKRKGEKLLAVVLSMAPVFCPLTACSSSDDSGKDTEAKRGTETEAEVRIG